MKQKDQSTVLNLHLRFNSANARHQEAAEYLELVKTKYKAALVTPRKACGLWVRRYLCNI